MVAELTVFTSRSGLPTLKVNGMPYYSPVRSIAEVSRFFERRFLDRRLSDGWGAQVQWNLQTFSRRFDSSLGSDGSPEGAKGNHSRRR